MDHLADRGKGHDMVWLIAKERKELKVLIVTASEGERGTLDLWDREKFRQVKRSVPRDKSKFLIALIR